MASARIIAAVVAAVSFGIILKSSDALPVPDSAGIVEMVNGLAYGNIPYGSVSGNLGNYVPARSRSYSPYNSIQEQASASVLVDDTRTAPLNPVGY